MSAEDIAPLLAAARRCTNLEACAEENLCDEDIQILALWYDRKHLRAQLAAERAKVAELVGALEMLVNISTHPKATKEEIRMIAQEARAILNEGQKP